MFETVIDQILKECSLYRDSDFKAYFEIREKNSLIDAKMYCRKLILEKLIEKQNDIKTYRSTEQNVEEQLCNEILDEISTIIKKVKSFCKYKISDLVSSYQPKHGDLLFGLSDVINSHLEQITGKSTDYNSVDAERFSWYLKGIELGACESLSQAPTPSCSDVDTSQISDVTMLSDDSCLSAGFQPSEWLKYYQQMIYGNYHRVSLGQQKRYGLFLYHLEQSKYNPEKALNCLPDSEKLLREGRNLSLQQQKTLYAMRLACKFGIDFIKILAKLSDEKEISDIHKPKIHYLLDGIDFDIVTNYRNVHGDDRGKFLPVITSELKHIFRHWQDLKDTVNFYLNGNRVTAPWETCPEKWHNLGSTKKISPKI